MKKKARTIDVKKAREIDVKVAGIAVRVALDDDGRPLRASAGAWGDEDIHLAGLAAQHVFDRAERAAGAVKRKRESDERVARSSERRDAASHPANTWFAFAQDAAPRRLGMKLLVHAARQLAIAAEVEPKELAEITEDRARRFLERQRNPGL